MLSTGLGEESLLNQAFLSKLLETTKDNGKLQDRIKQWTKDLGTNNKFIIKEML